MSLHIIKDIKCKLLDINKITCGNKNIQQLEFILGHFIFSRKMCYMRSQFTIYSFYKIIGDDQIFLNGHLLKFFKYFKNIAEIFKQLYKHTLPLIKNITTTLD